MDINGDGKVDIVAGGNRFVFPPQFGRLDASYGHVLINQGQGQYKWLEPAESGLSERGEIRAIESIAGKSKKHYLLIVQNDKTPVLFKMN